MSDTLKCCPQCGVPMPLDAPKGLCPKCLMASVLNLTESGTAVSSAGHRYPAPSIEALAPFFPRLEILEQVGQGGMGFVYKARQEQLDRWAALKVLPSALAEDPGFAERFSREGRLLARLNHPNIVTIHDFGVATCPNPSGEATASGVPAPRYFYLLMEYIDGVNLRQAMHAGRFTPEQALDVVPKICEALQYAHDEGVLHRDIKPENILVDSRGRVKIADFGIAKLLDAKESDQATLTGTGATLGTPHYMAPEQVENPGKVDHRADIYSLGVVFYEMLTGELPIGRFAPPSEKSSVNERIDAIVLRALAKERELRQQSATEVRTEIQGVGNPGKRKDPPSMENPERTSPCLLTRLPHLNTLRGRLAHPFQESGDLKLFQDRLVFSTEDATDIFCIPLASIRSIRVLPLEWWSIQEAPLLLVIVHQQEGRERTLLLRPGRAWAEPLSRGNRFVLEWQEVLEKACSKGLSGHPAEGPKLPEAPRIWNRLLIPMILAAGPMGFLGAMIVDGAEKHHEIMGMLLGFCLCAVGLFLGFFSLFLALIKITTRRAWEQGHLEGLVEARAGRPGSWVLSLKDLGRSKTEPPVAGATPSPWPRRVFFLIVVLVVLPLLLMGIGLLVPAMVWQKTSAGPMPRVEVALQEAQAVGHVLQVKMVIRSHGGELTWTPHFQGESPLALPDPVEGLPGTSLVYPSPDGEPSTQTMVFRSPPRPGLSTVWTQGWVMATPERAERAAGLIRETFKELNRSGKHVRQQLFLFEDPRVEDSAGKAWIQLDRSTEIRCVDPGRLLAPLESPKSVSSSPEEGGKSSI